MSDTEEVVEEVWESQIPGRTFVEVRDYDGRPRSRSVVGVGQRLRLYPKDRIRTQERCRTTKLDPFLNGTLVRIDRPQSGDPTTESSDALSQAELTSCFALELDDFREYVPSLSEVNVRRLMSMAADAGASVNHEKFLREQIEERFAIGADTPTYREMMAGPNTPT